MTIFSKKFKKYFKIPENNETPSSYNAEVLNVNIFTAETQRRNEQPLMLGLMNSNQCILPQRGILSEPGATPWETVMMRRAVNIGLETPCWNEMPPWGKTLS